MQRYPFQTKHRLRNKGDFARVFAQVEARVGRGPLLLLARRNQRTHPRLGLVVGKKHLKNARDRNHIKRLVREHFRLRQHDIKALDIVFLSRAGCQKTTNTELHRHLHAAFNKLSKHHAQN
ncbi:MAG: ribonuclease P protein component [Cellvibrionales bacterium]|nr:ribonuclease P protein component [Cellvibrionales bacterium]